MAIKIRLDQLLFKRGIAESREKAKRLIMTGKVFNAGNRLDKPGVTYPEDIEIEIKGDDNKYVSRGAYKLSGFLKDLDISVKDFKCIDIGASTGGFTDLLLQEGAESVTTVDVGKGVLHWKLRNDERVKIFEGINARYIKSDDVGDEFDLAVMDLSFISLEKVLPAVFPLLKESSGMIISLIKPQFEAGREHVGKGGVVRSKDVQLECVKKIINFALDYSWNTVKYSPSVIKGPSGNQEYLILLKNGE